MNYRNINKKIRDKNLQLFDDTLWVYLRSSKSKGSNYDPYRNTGYTQTNQSPIPIKANIRQIAGNSLIAREIGLVQSGAIEIIVKDSDINFFKYCEKIKYDSNEYTPFNKALGNKIQIFKTDFNLARIILFRVK